MEVEGPANRICRNPRTRSLRRPSKPLPSRDEGLRHAAKSKNLETPISTQYGHVEIMPMIFQQPLAEPTALRARPRAATAPTRRRWSSCFWRRPTCRPTCRTGWAARPGGRSTRSQEEPDRRRRHRCLHACLRALQREGVVLMPCRGAAAHPRCRNRQHADQGQAEGGGFQPASRRTDSLFVNASTWAPLMLTGRVMQL